MDMRISTFTERLSVAAFSANRYDADVVIRNFRKMRFRTIGISTKYRTNYESAATINNFRHIKNYIPFIWHLSRFHFTSSYHALFFSNRVYYFVLFSLHVYYLVNCTKYVWWSYSEEVAHNERRQKCFTHFSLSYL